jgi:uncharacterized repeat protein (TIGR03803 family)
MNKSFARSAMVGTLVFLFVLEAAAGAQTYSVLTSFAGANGSYPFATPRIDSLGNVFGTTQNGGNGGCGVVFELVNKGGGRYIDNTLYDFTCGVDGSSPDGGVARGSAGDFYGTTFNGGAFTAGVAYELVNHGGGSYKFELIHAFSGSRGGSHPTGDLVWLKGSLYGVTYQGGGGGCLGGCGTVYQLTKSGDKWAETVLHIFNDRGDGQNLNAGVVFDGDGNIYGTTQSGGSFGYGTVFKLSPKSSGNYQETILHSFDGLLDGCNIFSGVVLDSAGDLYGTAEGCGVYGYGTVYRLQRSGSKYEFRAIFAFDGTNGENPGSYDGHLAVDSTGNVYGTTVYGPGNGCGTVFKLAAQSFLYNDLHDFNCNETDGGYPFGGVSVDALGNLYGTTESGGRYDVGTVWEIANP